MSINHFGVTSCIQKVNASALISGTLGALNDFFLRI